MKNILIGNGLNLTNYNENSFLSKHNIYDRFIENLNKYWIIINKLVNLKELNIEPLKQELNSADGIETLAGKVFQYIYNKIELKRKFSWNDSYRLIEILGEISIKSIFFCENKFLIPKISDEYKSKIERIYDNIFTLNYIEDWDNNGNVKYLHGNLKKYVRKYSNIGSMLLSNNKQYLSFKEEEYEKIDFKDIVFMPTNSIVNKYNYIVQGLCPRDNLYPADDLVPYSGRDIYKYLDNLDNIDVFGMSPYGDETIIGKIKKIENKKIYVHNLNKAEIDEWKKYEIENCFVDSNEFLDN